MNQNSKELEKQILAIIKIDSNVIDEYNITDDLFLNETHIKIFHIFKRIHDKGIKIDDIIIYDAIKDDSSIPMSYIASLDAITSANAEYYIKQQQEINRIEKLKQLGINISDWIKSKESSEIIQLIDESITKISGMQNSKLIHAKDRIVDILGQIQAIYESGGALKGLSTGYHELDTYTNGLQNQDMIIIGARPSIGKTAIALNVVANMIKAGVYAGMFTLEMSTDAILTRIITSEAELNLGSVKSGKLRGADFHNLTTAASTLFESNFLIDDKTNISLSELKSQSRKMKRMGVQIIFIDYLTLIKWSDLGMIKRDAFGEISKSIKNLARELNIPIVVLSQINREGEGKKPSIAHLRETGDLEQDADIVILLHRERSVDIQDTDIIIAKNRNGATGEFQLEFVKEYTKFKDKTYAGHNQEHDNF